jgi:ribosomal protein L3
MTHGSKNHRAPGAIGMGTTPGRVLPGKKKVSWEIKLQRFRNLKLFK